MKKIMILAIIALFGLSVASCKCTTKDQEAQEEVVETVDSLAVETPVDGELVAE